MAITDLSYIGITSVSPSLNFRRFRDATTDSELRVRGHYTEFCETRLLKDMELDSAMPQLYKLFSLVATIGASSAGVERSFSCLKRLKSYTRNTMGQGRLSSLALLAIERTLVKSLEKAPSWYDRVTEHFLEKECRAEFTYK